MREVVEGNAVDLAQLADGLLAADQVAAVDRSSREMLEQRGWLLEARRVAGRVRHCHGDLHLRNIVRIDGRPVLFDCIEFDEDFACIDVLYDLAFLLMDLIERKLAGHAQRALHGLCRAHGRGRRAGLAAAVHRRPCRHPRQGRRLRGTAAGRPGPTRPRGAAARDYLALARRALDPPSPRLVAIGGVPEPASRRSPAALAPALGALPGAVVLRSDVARKRLLRPRADRAATGRSLLRRDQPPRVRDPGRDGDGLAARRPFGDRRCGLRPTGAARCDRGRSAAGRRAVPGPLAHRTGKPSRRRVDGRRGDASDADARIVRQQRAIDASAVGWRQIDAARALDDVAAEATAAIATASLAAAREKSAPFRGAGRRTAATSHRADHAAFVEGAGAVEEGAGVELLVDQT